MPREREELQKVTLNLYQGDYEKLMVLFSDVGAATIIRRVVRKFIQQIETKGTASVEAGVEINI